MNESDIPCHRVLGHGEYCCEERLCGSCSEILKLRNELAELSKKKDKE